MSEWRDVTLGDFLTLQRGFDLTEKASTPGTVSVISSGGSNYTTDVPKVKGPGVVTGRKGVLGRVHWSDGPYWPHDTTLWVKDFKGSAPRFVYYLLQTLPLAALDVGAANPTLNRNHAHLLPIRVPDVTTQAAIAAMLRAFDDLIENNRRRVNLLEEMARAIYREWFVKFCYPGREGVSLVDSRCGPVPKNWDVDTVASVARRDRNSVAGGPFGSKLGRKDYQPFGVPVIRGGNLRMGGGFDESDFVFVTDAKAAELRSAWARRGDIVITQRGTLGQVGRIPAASKFDLYVLSQSQMKVTVDERSAQPAFVYMQLSSEKTTQRFVAQAITAGVPHVNLGLLRDFAIVLPPNSLQLRFSDAVEPLLELAFGLERERARLIQLRDLLLPKLVTGQIDVSALDLDALVEEKVT